MCEIPKWRVVCVIFYIGVLPLKVYIYSMHGACRECQVWSTG